MTNVPNPTPDQQPMTPDPAAAEMMAEVAPSMEQDMMEPPDPALDEAMMAEMMAAEQAASESAPTDEPAMLDEEMLNDEISTADVDAPTAAELVEAGLALGPDKMDPATLKVHPYAELLPMMRPSEYSRFKTSIELEGQLETVVLFEELLLDGRNRRQVCHELGIPVRVRHFQGTADAALLYVISANQHRRDLSKPQRAAVATDLMPMMSGDINQKRIARLRKTLAAKKDGECLLKIANTQNTADKVVSARAIAADLMGVSSAYVGRAIQLKRESPELFSKVRAGSLTISGALKQLAEAEEPNLTKKRALARKQLAAIMAAIGDEEDKLDDLLGVLDQFATRVNT